jgi:hypothetical protein
LQAGNAQQILAQLFRIKIYDGLTLTLGHTQATDFKHHFFLVCKEPLKEQVESDVTL